MVVPSPSPLIDKRQLRQEMRAKRRAFADSLAPGTRAALEEALARILEPLLLSATAIAGYQPMRDEISVLRALERAGASARIVALPAFTQRDSRMTFRSGPPIEPGPWGLLQPPADAPTVAPDLLLVPLLAIDRLGNRIGQGQGHYDRALPRLREAGARLIGVGWDFQLVDQAIAVDPWDVALDGFASPAELRMFAR